jgi:hypothetical protein
VGGILHVHIAQGKNLPVGSLQLTKTLKVGENNM